MTPEMSAVITGSLLAVSAVALAIREVLLGPDTPNYPSAPMGVRLTMFAWMLAVAVRSADLLLGAANGTPQTIGGTAIAASVCMTAYTVAMAIHVLRLRLPASFYRRMNRALYLTHCRPKRVGHALGELSLEGIPVAAPGEKPAEVPTLQQPSVH